jgi:EmrB/QacA subfamily drug resistance transporter
MTQLTSGREVQSGRSLVVPLVATGVLLSAVDLFIVNVALAQIAGDLGVADLADLSWVLNAYTIAYAALLVPSGRVSDRIGSKQTFLAGMAIFVVASGACAASRTLGVLVAFRALQAAGGALMIPSSLGLVLALTPLSGRARAVGAWAGFGGVGAALGPVVGGLLVAVHWQWVFLVNVPIGALAILAVARFLPAPPAHPGGLPGLPQAGVLIATAAALVTALVNGGRWGWSSRSTLGFVAVGAVGAVLICLMTRRSSAPLIEPALFRVRAFAAAALNLLAFHVAFGAMLLSAVLWMEQAWGWTPLRTGLGIAPGPLLVPVVARLIGQAPPCLRPQVLCGTGGFVFAGGVAWWALFATADPNYVLGFLPGMLLTGIGVGLALPTAISLGTANLPAHRFATGSAVLSMSRQMGITVGVALFVAFTGVRDTHAGASSFHHGWWTIVAFSLAAVGPTLSRGKRKPT